MNLRKPEPIQLLAGLLVLAIAVASLSASGQGSAASEGTYAVFPDVKLWYTDTGGPGVPIILLHARTGSSLAWEYQIPALTKAGFRVVAFDRRGSGRTVSTLSTTPAADDVIRLADYLKIDRFHLLGTAAGGFVAFDTALSYPNRVRSLTVANSNGSIEDEEAKAIGRRIRTPEFEALTDDVKELGPEYRAANPEGLRRWIELEKLSHAPGPAQPAQPFKSHVTLAALETLAMPVLIIAGGADLYAPPTLMRQFASRIKGASFVVIPDVGHSGYWESPTLFNKTLVDFLVRHKER
jgi:pimeloyl-ACP methyl ester carboxylesterase